MQDATNPEVSDDPRVLRSAIHRLRLAAQAERDAVITSTGQHARGLVLRIEFESDGVNILCTDPTGDRDLEVLIASQAAGTVTAVIEGLRVRRYREALGAIAEGQSPDPAASAREALGK